MKNKITEEDVAIINAINERITSAEPKLSKMVKLITIYSNMIVAGHEREAQQFKNLCWFGVLAGMSEDEILRDIRRRSTILNY